MKKLYTLLLLISFSVTAQMPTELLTDGNFEANNAAGVWYGNALNIRNDNPGSGGADDNYYNYADVETAGAAYTVNLSQAVTLTQGSTYTLSFEASTSAGNSRTIVAGIGQSADPYGSATETITLTDTNDPYTYDFVASFAGPHRVLFDMGADTGIVVIDNVSLIEKDVSGGTGAENNLLLEDFDGSPNTEAFEGLTSATIEADPAAGGTYGNSLKLVTNTGGNPWQGATIYFAAGSYANISTNKTIAVDVRVIAATNKHIKEEIAQNRFREDLYHRLAVIEIHVPALNNRRDDIPLLATHFLSLLTPKKELLPDAVDALQKMDWTGNIRQLRNFIERLHILGGHQISAQDVSKYTLT